MLQLPEPGHCALGEDCVLQSLQEGEAISLPTLLGQSSAVPHWEIYSCQARKEVTKKRPAAAPDTLQCL